MATNNLSKSLAELASNVIYAEHTQSEYYEIGSIKVRLSDHMSSNMDCDLAVFSNRVGKQNVYIVIPTIGIFKEVQWFGKVSDVIEFITRFESIARLLIKHHTVDVPSVQNNALSNALSAVSGVSCSNNSTEVPLTEWKRQLKFVYGCKLFNSILDQIFELNHSQELIDKIKKIGALTTEARGQVLEKILAGLKRH